MKRKHFFQSPLPRHCQRGFTLVEVSLYMGLVVILLGILTALFTSTLEMYMDATSTSAIQEEGRYVVNRISYDVRRSSSILDPSSGDSSAQLQLVIEGVVYRYYLDNDRLMLDRGGVVDAVTTNRIRVESVAWQNVGTLGGNPTVSLSLALWQTGDAAKPNRHTFETTAGIRL